MGSVSDINLGKHKKLFTYSSQPQMLTNLACKHFHAGISMQHMYRLSLLTIIHAHICRMNIYYKLRTFPSFPAHAPHMYI